MQLTGTHIHYYFSCKRQLWLFANGINMEHTSDSVSEGKLLHETSYSQRSERFQEIEVGPVKIDYYDAKRKVIHEVKKSSKLYDSHIWQLKYYILILERAGVKGVTGVLEYPKEHKKEEVLLSDRDRDELREILEKVDHLIHSEDIPALLFAERCKNCSYYDFCYCNESE